MTLRRLISLSLLLFSWQTVRAQFLPADDFFHEGAQSYITNNLAKAREAVDQGLKFYPDDAKLKKLDELLKQKNQQQQSQQDQKQDQQQQDQQKSPDKNQDKKEQQKKDQQQDKQEQQKKDAAQQQQQKEQKSGDAKEDKSEEKGKEGQMTPQEAKQLLDAQKNDEMLLPANRKDRPPDSRKVVKDW